MCDTQYNLFSTSFYKKESVWEIIAFSINMRHFKLGDNIRGGEVKPMDIFSIRKFKFDIISARGKARDTSNNVIICFYTAYIVNQCLI